jgi:hypothetical protein
MTTIIAIILFLIFLFISSIHFYWAFGGNWGSDAVLPTKDDNNTKVLNPKYFTNINCCIWLIRFWPFHFSNVRTDNF